MKASVFGDGSELAVVVVLVDVAATAVGGVALELDAEVELEDVLEPLELLEDELPEWL